MIDPWCTARHDVVDPSCRCHEYARIRTDERRRAVAILAQSYARLTPARQGKMTATAKARVEAMRDLVQAASEQLG